MQLWVKQNNMHPIKIAGTSISLSEILNQEGQELEEEKGDLLYNSHSLCEVNLQPNLVPEKFDPRNVVQSKVNLQTQYTVHKSESPPSTENDHSQDLEKTGMFQFLLFGIFPWQAISALNKHCI